MGGDEGGWDTSGLGGFPLSSIWGAAVVLQGVGYSQLWLKGGAPPGCGVFSTVRDGGLRAAGALPGCRVFPLLPRLGGRRGKLEHL